MAEKRQPRVVGKRKSLEIWEQENGVQQPTSDNGRPNLQVIEGRVNGNLDKVGVMAQQYPRAVVGASPSKSGIMVECDLAAYKGLKVLFRTSNGSRRMRERPEYTDPQTVRTLRANFRDRVAEASVFEIVPDNETTAQRMKRYSDLNEAEEKRDEVLRKLREAEQKAADEHHKRVCAWLPIFVIGFEDWPFQEPPPPDPEKPETYNILHEEMEDLYVWLQEVGYAKALAAQVGNS